MSLRKKNKSNDFRSTMKTVYWRSNDPILKLASYVDWGAGLYYPMLRKFFQVFFKDDFPGQGKAIYLQHNKEIRDLVPANQLLEYNIKDGWGPLCDFLNEPKPCEPFPQSNDTRSFVKRCKNRNLRQLLNGALRFFTICILTAFSVYILTTFLL
jgi:hypothetical protein